MRYRLRHLDLDDKMCQQVSLEVFARVYPQELICEQLSLHQAWEERERSLNMFTLIQLLLAASLWTRLAFPRVLERLGRPLYVLGLSLAAMQVTGPAITYRRQQLGIAPLQGLFARCCRPLCSWRSNCSRRWTPGCFCCTMPNLQGWGCGTRSVSAGRT
jgi:hypothetical protein